MSRAKIHISPGNTKMGKVPSISLTPCATCAKDAPCKKVCYARKAYRMYEQTRKAYQCNTRLAKSNPVSYWTQLEEYVAKKKPRFFRFHVSGDILDDRYFYTMADLCAAYPDTRFLCFTKRYDIVAERKVQLYDNLSLILSAWPGYELHNPRKLPVAWMIPRHGKEDRLYLSPKCFRVVDTDKRVMECSGNCETCGACFDLALSGCDVMFRQH